jgi:hypothetical protein
MEVVGTVKIAVGLSVNSEIEYPHLNPCTKCGSKTSYFRHCWDEKDRYQLKSCAVTCDRCGRRTKIYKSRKLAAAGWNNGEYNPFWEKT